ncbi:uncharacterized protein [Gossypium hirsutum]|uniref:RNase H type-1 domain-containing protein n=1 Tax=Gossypium hirsutum TaxID=3635 RepID=A0A1U8NH07_GOSHI|nr:uncharacterized protein LOC107947147 [Gossypium hirsutum]
MGGLGIRELRLFNVALLGRQVWRLINYRDTLCYKVLSAMYFSQGDVFQPKSMDKPSFTWKSIAKAAQELYDGFGWTVGNDKSIKIWHDNWGFEGLSGQSICLDKRLVKEEYACDLFNDSKNGWDKNKVLDIYGGYMGDKFTISPFFILAAKIDVLGSITRTVCFLLNLLIRGCCLNSHNILPTYDKISSFRSGFDDTCLRCGKERETLIHAMKDCLLAHTVLEYGGLNHKFLVGNYSNCIDWIEDTRRELDCKAGVEEEAKVTWERAAALSNNFRIFNLLVELMLPRKAEEKGWQKLTQGVIKINFDSSVHGNRVYYGLVSRDSEGFVHGGRVGVVEKDMNVEWAELLAMEECIIDVWSNNWTCLGLESNCSSLMNRFNKRKTDLTMLGHRLREIEKQFHCFNFFKFCWAPRCCNKVVDSLCNSAKTSNCTKDFNMDYPSDVQKLVLNDAIN